MAIQSDLNLTDWVKFFGASAMKDALNTGRISSFIPEYQSFPIDHIAGRDRKRYYGFDPGNKSETAIVAVEFDKDGRPIAADYEKIELRIMTKYVDDVMQSVPATSTIVTAPPTTLDGESLIDRLVRLKREIGAARQSTVTWCDEGPVVHTAGLARWGACVDQYYYFKLRFGSSLILTQEAIEQHGQFFDGVWFAEKLRDFGVFTQNRFHRLSHGFAIRRYWKHWSVEDCQSFWRGILWLLWEAQLESYEQRND